MKLYIITSEPKNFVPQELHKAALEHQLDCEIIDVDTCVQVDGNGERNIYHRKDKDAKLEPLLLSGTFVIPRLSEHQIELKLGLLTAMERSGATILNTVEGLALCNNKLASQIELNTNKIHTPLTLAVQSTEALDDAIEVLEQLLEYPIILKTLHGTHGIGVMKVDSRASLASVGQTLIKSGISFLIQEFIPHKKSMRMIMLGNKLLAANVRGQAEEKQEFRTNSHLGSETEAYEPSAEELALGANISQLFKCSFCAIDYIKTDENKLIVFEVNGSPGLEGIQKNYPERNLAAAVIASIGSGLEPKSTEAPCDCEASEVAAQKPEEETATETVPPEETPPDTAEPKTAEPSNDLPTQMLGEVEEVHIHRLFPEGVTVQARIDTGAKYCSFHVDALEFDTNWAKFSRDSIIYKIPVSKVVKIKNVHNGESSDRPVVALDLTVHGTRINRVLTTLTDRSTMKYQFLLGRTALEVLGLPVIVPQTARDEQPESEVFVDENGEEE